jgi:hypothetical protein
MSRVHRWIPASLVVLVLITVSACASVGPYYPTRSSRGGVDQRAYHYGFNDGREKGVEDARERRSFDYDRHRVYRNADVGYSGFGNRNAYRSLYREGFAAGYDEGYRRWAYSGRRPGYGGSPRYGTPRYSSLAAEHGYRDGFEQGRKDRGDRRRADPVRASRYRSADNDYDRRYGSLDDYKREYRAAFLQGYNAGYR